MLPNEKFFKNLEDFFGVNFKNRNLLISAFCHPSLVFLKPSPFQRLEFLGDRVLSLVVAEEIYQKFPKLDEGDLAKILVHSVRYETLAEIAVIFKFDVLLLENNLCNKHDLSQGCLADTLEAFFGALFLDQGLDCCQKIVRKYWKDFFVKTVTDPKSKLQEICQGRGFPLPVYSLKEECILNNSERIFKVKVLAMDFSASGEGKSKKKAEQDAAKKILQKIES